MLTTTISTEFLKRLQTIPTWTEMAYAFSNRLIPVKTVIDYAKAKLAAGNDENPDERFIASATMNESIAESVRRIAGNDLESRESESRVYWANVLLAWVYENRSGIDDLLSVVEEIYTDFDYPPELAPFVRYMPSKAPDLGSREANERRMIDSIGRYVVEHVLES